MKNSPKSPCELRIYNSIIYIYSHINTHNIIIINIYIYVIAFVFISDHLTSIS